MLSSSTWSFIVAFSCVASVAIITLQYRQQKRSGLYISSIFIVSTREIRMFPCGAPADIRWNAENASSYATLNVSRYHFGLGAIEGLGNV